MFQFLPHSFLQMSMIFLSIVIEAFPFVLFGCVVSGGLQVFLTPERVKKILPKNKFLSICIGSMLGFFFPSCECGIVPIVHQFVKKGVPEYTAFAFMLTAPVINPIVMFSTYIAFSNSVKFVIWRVCGSLLLAVIVGSWLAYINKQPILKKEKSSQCCSLNSVEQPDHPKMNRSFWNRCFQVLSHSLDEFFDTGRYLIFGSLLAACMQTYLPTGALLKLGHTKFLAVIILLLLAAILSLCSEADAFIGSSLLSLFGTGPVVGFLVFGPVVDIKNLLMMKRSFNSTFIIQFVSIVTIVVTIYALFI